MKKEQLQRLPAEQLFQEEIDALIKAEKNPIPEGWKMSPKSVLTYICGGKVGKKNIIPKYIGNQRLVEIAISTLVTDRALLLIGEPGTAKSWLSEHLAAAINGNSTRVIQGTAGTTEEQIRYSWNYAMLIANGPTEDALIPSPIYKGMEDGAIVRVEEISRCASEVQDALISLLSEKRLNVPELELEIPAKKGFSIIATANTRDKGVNEMSAALKRRFNIVVLPSPSSLEAEMDIVRGRIEQLAGNLDLNAKLPKEEVIEMAVLLEAGKISNEELGKEVEKRLSKGIPADLGAGWFEGLSMKNHYILIARLGLWEKLDKYISSLDEEEFKRALLFLRRAFADFSSEEKHNIAENMGEIWGLNKTEVSAVLNQELKKEELEAISALDDFDFDDI